MNANALNAYKETTIKTASQGRLIVMLYDEVLKQLDLAIEMLDEKTKQLDAVNNAIVKAQAIVTELQASLDVGRGGEIARNLFSLYTFFNRELLDANMRKDGESLKTVRHLMASLREAWAEIVSTPPPSEPIVHGLNIAG